MELINGKTLTTWLDGQDLEKIPGMMRTYADLIDTIHDAGIVHGDLNTGNIIVTPSGWTAIDFGFSMSKKEDSESWDTIAATLLVISGSLFYPKGPELEDLQKNLRSWIKGVKDTSDIRDIADHIESSLEPAKAEFDESEGPIDEFLRRLTSLIKQ
jgi:tRNA A-37 threonylcarbamoyl transferase component Bud32